MQLEKYTHMPYVGNLRKIFCHRFQANPKCVHLFLHFSLSLLEREKLISGK